MCFFCDGGTPAEWDRWLDNTIDEHGYAVLGVEGPDRSAVGGWAYTIGLTEKFGHPELILTGECCFGCGKRTLAGVASLVCAGDRFDVGDELPLGPREGIRIGSVHPSQWRTDRFNGWLDRYEDRPWLMPPKLALQVLWLDKRGRWQDDKRNGRWPYERLDRPSVVRR